MSKRRPTLEERLRRSQIDRLALIMQLKRVLAEAPPDVELCHKERLAARIQDLERRQANPTGSLWRGRLLRQEHDYMGTTQVASPLWA